ncbi:hypothetical protein K5X82_01790 [Halosquirtibacter xylanolyticus]|uniref:hypothetical protein n=1 Tax=Halosquirtibacter xylanolyticus TaxID=3374599 RepID=UPI00374A00F3|nr:hypothetical protein K5X82_01790 [Prolixibacteraceae bacterium]
MLKIPYPIEEDDKIKMEVDYLNALSNKAKYDEIKKKLSDLEEKISSDSLVKRIDANCIQKYLSKIFIISISKMLLIKDTLEKYPSYLEELNQIFKKETNSEKIDYHYTTFQPDIRDFFQNVTNLGVKLESCFYCNISHINPFALPIQKYKDVIDFLNKASKKELKQINDIGKARAESIFEKDFKEQEELIGINKINNKDLEIIIKDIEQKLNDTQEEYSQYFTLDHFMPKAKYPCFSLSLYNFVPSCHTCNCTLKVDKFDKVIEDNISSISPSSEDFTLDRDFRFHLLYPSEKKQKEFILSNEILSNTKAVEAVFDLFALEGRYKHFEEEANEMVDKSMKYSDSNLDQISRLLKVSTNELEKDIYGADLYDEKCQKPLSKLRKDIAKQIDII